MPMPRKLTDDQIVTIRESYAQARDAAESGDPELYETVFDTETRLAMRFGVSRSLVRQIVIGTAYADVEGPLDERRRAGAKEVVGKTPPTAVRITIARPGGEPKSFIHPPGTTVLVEGVLENPDNFHESGRSKTTAANGSTGGASKSHPAGMDEDPDKADRRRMKELRKLMAREDNSRKWQKLNKEYESLRDLHGLDEVDSAGTSRGGVY